MALTVIEFCVGGGGQALGLEMAGFNCLGAVEIDPDCCATLKHNRPDWPIMQADMTKVDGSSWAGADLFAAGVPCPPFSIAGKQLGQNDDRDMFPAALRLISQIKPRAVMLENVPGFASQKFKDYRLNLIKTLNNLGYEVDCGILEAADYGVAQLRPRFVLVALNAEDMKFFEWPQKIPRTATVGQTLYDLMANNGWVGAAKWAAKAASIAPTVVGGSKKHGGPDLGPTRARAAWLSLGVDGKVIAQDAPGKDTPEDFVPRLTIRMVARIQSFPDGWQFHGKKTTAYRQVGNAFPPLVAKAVGIALKNALTHKTYSNNAEDKKIQYRLLEKADDYERSMRHEKSGPSVRKRKKAIS